MTSDFDPDAYLSKQESGEFDPNSYLSSKQNSIESYNPGIIAQAWQDLKIPEKVIGQGYQDIAEITPESIGGPPTGNLSLDIAKGTPKILAESAAQVLPKLYSRGAILGQVAGEALGTVPEGAWDYAGNQLARVGKVLSGNKIEDIKNLFENPEALYMARSMNKAKEIYGEAVKGAGEFPEANADTAFDTATQIAKDALAKVENGTAGPLEALEGRQNLDNVIRATKGTEGKININTSRLRKLYELRDKLDAVVKTDPGLDRADQIYAQAKLAAKFRQILPVNQGGTPSQLKSLLSGLAVGAMHGNPLVPIAMSPATIGAVTSGLGFLNKAAPYIAPYLPGIGQAAGTGMGFLNSEDQSK